MSVRTRDEIIESLNALVGENNTSDEYLSLLEDISDSMTPPEVDWEQRYNELDSSWRERYKKRFLGATDDFIANELVEPEIDETLKVKTYSDLFKSE